MNRWVIELLQLGLGLIPFARPYQWNLDRLFARSNKIRLYSSGASEGQVVDRSGYLCEVTGSEVESIRQALRLEPLKGSPPCMCLGTIAIEFWKDEKQITTLALHHHRTLRIPGAWFLDGVLSDGPALARWLAQNGHPEELDGYNQDQRSREAMDLDDQRFHSQAPARIRGLQNNSISIKTLVAPYKDSTELCQDLLRWFGTAQRKWGHGLLLPENNVADAIRDLGKKTLVEATASGLNEEGILRGASRYWCLQVAAREQLLLPDALWQKLRTDPINSDQLAMTVDSVRRRRLRQEAGLRNSLGQPEVIGSHGPYCGLLSCPDGIYALAGSKIVLFPDGDTIYDTKSAEATMAYSYGLQVALPEEGKVLKFPYGKGRPRVETDSQIRPRLIPAENNTFGAWNSNDHLVSRLDNQVLFKSPRPIAAAYMTREWLFWSDDRQVLRLKLMDSHDPEMVLDQPAVALAAQGNQVVAVCADRSLWLGSTPLGKTSFSPLALAADDHSIYILSQDPDSKWVLEHSLDGVLAQGLEPAPVPSLALTISHLYGAFGSQLLAFERLP